MEINIADKNDIAILTELPLLIWEDNDCDELYNEIEELIEADDAIYFIGYIDKKIIGFSQCQLRYDYVEGTSTSPVGYLEAIYIKEEYRKKNYGRKLVRKCEEWSKSKNCKEFASDCELDNINSLHFHLNIGFKEENRIICFSKKI